MDGIRYRCRHPASSLFGPSRHCGLGLMNGPRFRYRQGLFDLLSRWPIMWTMRFVGARRPISAFGPPDATHFYVLYQFFATTLISYRKRHFPSRTTRIWAVPSRQSIHRPFALHEWLCASRPLPSRLFCEPPLRPIRRRR